MRFDVYVVENVGIFIIQNTFEIRERINVEIRMIGKKTSKALIQQAVSNVEGKHYLMLKLVFIRTNHWLSPKSFDKETLYNSWIHLETS